MRRPLRVFGPPNYEGTFGTAFRSSQYTICLEKKPSEYVHTEAAGTQATSPCTLITKCDMFQARSILSHIMVRKQIHHFRIFMVICGLDVDVGKYSNMEDLGIPGVRSHYPSPDFKML